MHVTSGQTEIFIASDDGSPDPMHAAPDVALLTQPSSLSEAVVRAPHICTVVSVVAVGLTAAKGAAVAQVRVLDTVVDIVTPVAGRITSVDSQPGDLVEFDMPILSLVELASEQR